MVEARAYQPRTASAFSVGRSVLFGGRTKNTRLPTRNRVALEGPGVDQTGSHPPGACSPAAFGGPEGANYSTVFDLIDRRNYGGDTGMLPGLLHWSVLLFPSNPVLRRMHSLLQRMGHKR